MYCSLCFKNLSTEFTHVCMPYNCLTCFQSKENILEDQCYHCSGMILSKLLDTPAVIVNTDLEKKKKYEKEMETYTNLCKDQRFDYKTFIEKKLYRLSIDGETEQFKNLNEFYTRKVSQKIGAPPVYKK